MQFFHHLVFTYVPEASSAIPEELHRGELRSILIHAMAHAFEALTLLLNPPEAVRQRVAREMAAVSDSVTADGDYDMNGLLKSVRKKWQVHKGRFEKVRHLLFGHYPDPIGTRKTEKNLNEYWSTIRNLQNSESNFDGTVIVDDDNDLKVDGRFRHTFIDVFHEAYLDSLYPPYFWGFDESPGESVTVAGFLDDVSTVFNLLTVPLIGRVIDVSDSPEEWLYRFRWHGPERGWRDES